MDCFGKRRNDTIAAMDHEQNMRVFVQVAQLSSFAAAARHLRLSTASASKHVAALERRVGTRLLDRTTRRVRLTESGRIYYERCIECLQAIDDADASIGELTRSPKGLLRITAPIDFGDHLMPVVADVMTEYPALGVDVRLTNRVVDMVEEGVDVAVRVAGTLEGNYVARPLARTRLAIFGAPAYFKRHGWPQRPEDLERHRHLVFTEPKPRDELLFSRNSEQVHVKIPAALTSNNAAAIQVAVRMGVGLTMIPSFVAARDLAAGAIVPALVDWRLPDLHVFAVYPHRRFLSPKVRVFVEALRERFGDGSRDPWWLDMAPEQARKRPLQRSLERRGK
jgi:DNA-binding transcriptional LysR family regulator